MKSFQPLLTLLIAVLLFTSCKKDNDSQGNSSVNRIKTYTETISSSVSGNLSESYNLNYDNDFRLTSMISISNPGDKFLFTYNNGNTFSFDIYGSNSLIIHEVVFINEMSFVDSTIQMNNEGDTMTEKYFYNAQKQLIRKNEYDYSSTGGSSLFNVTNYTYNNEGNIILEQDNGSSITYVYDQVIPNAIKLLPVYFSDFKQLPTKTIHNDGGADYTLNYTYTFDGNNRITSQVGTATNGDYISKTFTYF